MHTHFANQIFKILLFAYANLKNKEDEEKY